MTAIEWVGGRLRFIDQTRLPLQEIFIDTDDVQVVGEAIRRLQIRGAPAIGVAAAYALVLAVQHERVVTAHQLGVEFYDALNYLSRTRPTAVNLFASLDRMRDLFERVSRGGVESIRQRLLAEAQLIHEEDIAACDRIGDLGAELLGEGSTVLTHCNAGALATAGSGTALSIIITAAKQKKVVRVFVDETRPLFQGARLTSWELLREGINAVLIIDSTAAYLMQQRQVDAIIVGADRIAANGDTANKIGTYNLAVLAHHHSIPFYVAAPTSTVDLRTKSGKDIPIEERAPEEITHVHGIAIAPAKIRVFAPAFDVTPNHYITAIVTEAGVLKPPFIDAIASLSARPAIPSKTHP